MAKDTAEKIAALKTKQDQIAKRLNALTQKAKTDERKKDTRRKIIVGGLVLAALHKDDELAAKVRGLIGMGVTRPHDREAVADLLPTASTVPQSSPVVDFGRMAADDVAKQA